MYRSTKELAEAFLAAVRTYAGERVLHDAGEEVFYNDPSLALEVIVDGAIAEHFPLPAALVDDMLENLEWYTDPMMDDEDRAEFREKVGRVNVK